MERGASTGNLECSAWVGHGGKSRTARPLFISLGRSASRACPPPAAASPIFPQAASRRQGARLATSNPPVTASDRRTRRHESIASDELLSKSQLGGQIALSLMLMLATGQAGVWMPYPWCWDTRNEPSLLAAVPGPIPPLRDATIPVAWYPSV